MEIAHAEPGDLSALAAVSGVSAYTIYGLELGKNMPSLHTAVALCEALGITPNDLVKEEK